MVPIEKGREMSLKRMSRLLEIPAKALQIRWVKTQKEIKDTENSSDNLPGGA